MPILSEKNYCHLFTLKDFVPQMASFFKKPSLMDLALEAKSKFDSNLNFKKIDKKIVTFLSEESIVERTSNCTSYFDQHIFPFGSTLNVSMNVAGAVLVAPLVEWLLQILEVCGSNPVIGKNLYLYWTFVYCELCIEKTKIKKKRPIF